MVAPPTTMPTTLRLHSPGFSVHERQGRDDDADHEQVGRDALDGLLDGFEGGFPRQPGAAGCRESRGGRQEQQREYAEAADELAGGIVPLRHRDLFQRVKWRRVAAVPNELRPAPSLP
jgi:hypothetical protein